MDEQDNPIGLMPKLGHIKQFSVHSLFLSSMQRELMLQQRAKHKYHSWAWTNTCCSHQRRETNIQAGIRRLKKWAQQT